MENISLRVGSNRCPTCHHEMQPISPQHYRCDECQQNYIEQFICPICHEFVQCIQGCGAIGYLCPTDGLISSKKVITHYLLSK